MYIFLHTILIFLFFCICRSPTMHQMNCWATRTSIQLSSAPFPVTKTKSAQWYKSSSDLTGPGSPFSVVTIHTVYRECRAYPSKRRFTMYVLHTKPWYPAVTDKTKQYMQDMVKNILKTKVNTIVVFANKRRAAGFFPFVIDQNVTGKVWIGTEDWSVASTVSSIPGISTIGTVLGVAVQYTEFSGFEDFERRSVPRLKEIGLNSPFKHSVPCLQNTNLYEIAIQGFAISQYDIVFFL